MNPDEVTIIFDSFKPLKAAVFGLEEEEVHIGQVKIISPDLRFNLQERGNITKLLPGAKLVANGRIQLGTFNISEPGLTKAEILERSKDEADHLAAITNGYRAILENEARKHIDSQAKPVVDLPKKKRRRSKK